MDSLRLMPLGNAPWQLPGGFPGWQPPFQLPEKIYTVCQQFSSEQLNKQAYWYYSEFKTTNCSLAPETAWYSSMFLFFSSFFQSLRKIFPIFFTPPRTSLISHFQWMTYLHTLQQKQTASEIYSSSHHFTHKFILTCSYFRGKGLLSNLRGASLSTRGQIYHMFLDFIPISILRIFVPSSTGLSCINLWWLYWALPINIQICFLSN